MKQWPATKIPAIFKNIQKSSKIRSTITKNPSNLDPGQVMSYALQSLLRHRGSSGVCRWRAQQKLCLMSFSPRHRRDVVKSVDCQLIGWENTKFHHIFVILYNWYFRFARFQGPVHLTTAFPTFVLPCWRYMLFVDMPHMPKKTNIFDPQGFPSQILIFLKPLSWGKSKKFSFS